MFFVVSKLFGLLASPASLIVIGSVLTAVLTWTRCRRTLRVVAAATAALGIVTAILPTGAWLLAPLATRFAVPDLAAGPVDGIVVLGGAIDVPASVAAGRIALTGEGDRMTAFLALARQFPQARLLFSGGTASLVNRADREADFVPRFLAEQGIDPARLVVERESRNTRENALFSLAAAQPKPGERWLLVTSAWHMPRAVGSFRAVGWPVTAYPTGRPADAAAVGFEGWSTLRNLGRSRLALHEWCGLFAYRMQGYTESLIAAPI